MVDRTMTFQSVNPNSFRLLTDIQQHQRRPLGRHGNSDIPFSATFRPPKLRKCTVSSQLQAAGNDSTAFGIGMFLHDLMERASIDVAHAKAARESFAKQVAKLASGDRSIPGHGSCSLDLARAALEVSSEDDALVSHSSVPLPVDSYLERLHGMAMEFAGHHMPSEDRSPDAILCCLDKYLYGYKYFRRISNYSEDAKDYYLNMVLTRRMGTPVMLALIYSEIVNILNSWRVIDFVVDMEIPQDETSLPLPVVKKQGQKYPSFSKGTSNLLTPDGALLGILRRLKRIYWPWKLFNGSTEGSEFLKAAAAANHGIPMSPESPKDSLFMAPTNVMGSQVASARAAKHRMQRGISTSTSFGDMRCALAACERLVILGLDRKEQRDYGILLYHCGLYEPSFTYLNAYKNYISELGSNDEQDIEVIALENVLFRLRLLLAEQRWDKPAAGSSLGSPLSDPW